MELGYGHIGELSSREGSTEGRAALQWGERPERWAGEWGYAEAWEGAEPSRPPGQGPMGAEQRAVG